MNISDVKILQEIIEQDSNIQLIEIWDRVLYIRKYKGRNTFYSRKNLSKSCSGTYINIISFNKNEYKQLQRKYHPDRNAKYLQICQDINQWKDLLFEREFGSFDRTKYNKLVTACGPTTSIFTALKSASYWLEQTSGFRHQFGVVPDEAEEKAKRDRWYADYFKRRADRVKAGDKDFLPF